jgi:hypothetical protein
VPVAVALRHAAPAGPGAPAALAASGRVFGIMPCFDQPRYELVLERAALDTPSLACGLQLAKCKEEYALVTVSTIRGLAYMQFKDLAMSSLTAQSGTQACPYSASGGGVYDCSYAGTGTGSAFLINNEVITVNVSEIKVKVKCESVTTWTETLFSGSAHSPPRSRTISSTILRRRSRRPSTAWSPMTCRFRPPAAAETR